MLKPLRPFEQPTAEHYNKLLEDAKANKILPGWGIQTQTTSAGTAVSIDHGGVATAVGASGNGGGVNISEAFPARIVSSELVENGVYKYTFNRVLSGLGTFTVTVSDTDMTYAYNLAEVTTAGTANAWDGELVMMWASTESGVYLFSR